MWVRDQDDRSLAIWFRCPCGKCEHLGRLPIRPHASPSWEWNGDRDKPTLAPSVAIDIGNGPHWHGYLRNGIWEEC